jgi:hypothetical protein
MTGAACLMGAARIPDFSRNHGAAPRAVSQSRILIIPVVFLVWGLTGTVGADGLATKRALFAGGPLVGLAGDAPSPRSRRRCIGRAPRVLFNRTLGSSIIFSDGKMHCHRN